MKIRWNATLISALLISLCLMSFIPGSLRFASTWRQLYFEASGYQEQNLQMPLGFYSLGIEIIGLIVLWTGYRKKERWAWFLMLIILFAFNFPANVLTLLLKIQLAGSGAWLLWFQYIQAGDWPSIWIAVGVLNFLVMLVALLLPIKAFFWTRHTIQAESDPRCPK